jgi:NADPH:quinone reductase-like Zn-dependent oxidoreductase
MSMSTMMALRAHQRGGPETLVYEESPLPTRPGEGEVTVAVRAAAITFDELTWPETWEVDGVDRTPVIPSHEFSGVVTEIGADVDDLAVGDAVFGLVPFDRDGAAAEFVTVPSSSVAHKPASVSHVTAAAAVLPALTAWEALVDHAGLQSGQRLLIHGGAGSVGSFLIQWAKTLGAYVAVSTPSRYVETVRGLGADHVIVADQTASTGQTPPFDAAINAVGADTPEWLFAAVTRGGVVISLQEPADAAMADRYGVRAVFFVVTARQERLRKLASLLAGQAFQVEVADSFPLAEGRAAYDRGGRRRKPGKTVLIVGSPDE